jgi:hypothetical protein
MWTAARTSDRKPACVATPGMGLDFCRALATVTHEKLTTTSSFAKRARKAAAGAPTSGA